jgi:maltooligosyltrehalose synthase
MMRGALLSGVTMLAHELKRVATLRGRPATSRCNSLHEALVEFIAALPVYRTYLGTGPGSRRRAAHRRRESSIWPTAAIRRWTHRRSAFLRSLLLGELVDDPALAARGALLVKRLQQYTSGVSREGCGRHRVSIVTTLCWR